MIDKSDPSIKNAPQLGSKSYTCIPNGREPELSGLRAAAQNIPSIVHVDDLYECRELLYLILHEVGGYRVESFATGEAAYEFCKTERPALLITDLVRPGMDGLELCRLIRAHPTLNDLNIIILSAHTFPLHTGRTRLNHTSFLNKPFILTEIFTAVEKVMHLQGLTVPPQRKP